MAKYILVKRPEWYTGTASNVSVTNGRIYEQVHEHILVYCQANGLTEISSGFLVHHRDDNPENNEPENLELMTRAEHAKHHRPVDARSEDWCTDEVREQLSRGRKGKPHTEETKRKMSESQRKRMTPEVRNHYRQKALEVLKQKEEISHA